MANDDDTGTSAGLRDNGAASRILLVAPQPFHEDRGTPIAVHHVLRALSELGYRVDVLTFPTGTDIEIPGVRYFRTPNPLRFREIPIGLSFRKLFLDMLLFRSMRQRLSQDRYFCVHAVEEAGFLAAFLRRFTGTFVIYDMQSCMPDQLAGQSAFFDIKPVRELCRGLERWLLTHVDYVLPSAGLADYLRTVVPGVPFDEWHFPPMFPGALPQDPEGVRRGLQIPDGGKIVLYTGNFEEYQGIQLLIEAIAQVVDEHPEAYFVMVGANETEMASIPQALGSSLAEHVRLIPREPRENMPRYLAAADILVSPRIYGENIPLKIFDYLFFGKPIVATDIPAHRAVLDDTRTIFVEPDAVALGKGIRDLLADDRRAQALGEAARSYAAEHLSWAAFVEEIGRIYGNARETMQARETGQRT